MTQYGYNVVTKLFLVSLVLIFWQRLAYADISQTRVALQLLHISRQQFKGLYFFRGNVSSLTHVVRLFLSFED